jgi:hypothetical protein
VTVDDPLARLTAGLAEDEKRAKNELRVRELDRDMYGISIADIHIPGTIRDACDPRRVPREVALKRLILREHAPLTGYGDGVFVQTRSAENRVIEIRACEACSTLPFAGDSEPEYETWPCEYIRALADIYTEETT